MSWSSRAIEPPSAGASPTTLTSSTKRAAASGLARNAAHFSGSVVMRAIASRAWSSIGAPRRTHSAYARSAIDGSRSSDARSRDGDGARREREAASELLRLLALAGLARRERGRAIPHARDRPRVHVIVLHEAFGRDRALFVFVAALTHVPERDRERLLRVEREPIGSPLRERVEPVANAPQKSLGGSRRVELALIERAARDEHVERLSLAHGERREHPPRDLEIAQPARAELHVGLEEVDRVAVALVALLRVLGERAREVRRPPPRARQELRDEIAHGPRIARDRPQIDERRRGREVVLREREHLAWHRELVPHREPRVPERIQERVGESARVARPPDREEPHVDVAPEPHRRSPVAPRRREHDRRSLRRDVRPSARVGEVLAEHLVEQPTPHPREVETVGVSAGGGTPRFGCVSALELRRERCIHPP